MAGERYARLTLRVSAVQPHEGIGIWLAAAYRYFTPIAYTRPPVGNEFWRVDGPASPDPAADFLRNISETGASLAEAIRRQHAALVQQNYPSFTTVTDRFVNDTSPNAPYPPHREIIIEATRYDSAIDFHACDFPQGTGVGAYNPSYLDTIYPVLVDVATVAATSFGATDGSLALTARVNGGPAAFTYAWADDPLATGPTRQHLGAGVYTCVVSNSTGASLTVRVVITSDPRLEVTVARSGDDVTLVVTGGLPAYRYFWQDDVTLSGPTRLGLPLGTYFCTVMDARNVERLVTFTIAPRFYWSRNPIPLALDAGDAYRADPTTKPNLSFQCEVWVEPVYLSGTFTQVGTTLEQPADRAGRTVFQVQALLDAFLDDHVPAVPTQNVSTLERADPLFRRFYLKHAEVYGTPPEPAATTVLDQYLVLRGGLSNYESQAGNWDNYQAQVRPFLTWEAPVKAVLADQPEFLYYLAAQPLSFRVRVRVALDDGVETEFTLDGATAQVRRFEVYCQPVGYQALGLATFTQQGARVAWWEVSVVTADNVYELSEVRRFVLDARNYPHRRYLLYATSLGGMATYAALGEAQLDAEVSGEESARPLTAAYAPQLGDTRVLSRQLRPVLRLASGPRARAQQWASQDLLLSRRVLLLHGRQWLPGFVKAAKTTLLDESKPVLSQELDFCLPAEQQYTPNLATSTQVREADILSHLL